MIKMFRAQAPTVRPASDDLTPSPGVQAAMLDSAVRLGQARRIRADVGAALAALVVVADRVGVTVPPAAA
jgi:hypothetical protein